MPDNNNPHKDRRIRLRARFEEHKGFEGFHPHEVLEFLLYGGIPRKDTNVIAHELIDRFGSLKDVLSATVGDLLEVRNMTKNAALDLKAIYELINFLEIKDVEQEPKICNTPDAVRFAWAHIGRRDDEHFMLMCMDKQQNLIKREIISAGTPDRVLIFMRNILKVSLNTSATSVIIAHNHTGDNPRPSTEDYEVTETVFNTLGYAGIQLSDHVIVCKDKNKYFSFRRAGYLDSCFSDAPHSLKSVYMTLNSSVGKVRVAPEKRVIRPSEQEEIYTLSDRGN